MSHFVKSAENDEGCRVRRSMGRVVVDQDCPALGYTPAGARELAKALNDLADELEPEAVKSNRELIETLRHIGGGEGCIAYLKEHEVDSLLRQAADALDPDGAAQEGGS